ncbi:MAG TPA: hypothetical protein VFA03_15360 [Acetobacteraceae bacterium]|nr:hypothetical protein [Acetobacteraceae bacterium]
MNFSPPPGSRPRDPSSFVIAALMIGFSADLVTRNGMIAAAAAGATALFGGLTHKARRKCKPVVPPTLAVGPKAPKAPPSALFALSLMLGGFMAGCAPTHTTTVQQNAVRTLQGMCKIDATYQPVAVQVVSGLLPVVGAAGGAVTAAAAGVGAAAAVDQAAIHPLIVQACQSLGGVAVHAAPNGTGAQAAGS